MNSSTQQPVTGSELPADPKFPHSTGFYQELKRRVEQYFRSTGRRPRDCAAMYLKTALIFLWAGVSYWLLVFVATVWWQAVPLMLSLGTALATIGMSVMHDGNHQGYSDRRWVNRLMAWTLDLLGCSSYVWTRKHNIIHHSYTNITGHDDDINLGFLGRLSPHQKRHWYHRFQHYYLWPLYGWMAIKWQLFDDFFHYLTRQIAGHPLPRPRGLDLAVFVGGKVVFYSLAFALPLLVGHSWWVVLVGYLVAAGVTGLVLAIVFQLAHCVEEAEFPLPSDTTGRMESAWAEHQVATTVNFSRRSRVLCWLLGGLNFQIEHHLFPRVCHIHYPALSKLVEEACRLYGVRYTTHKSFWAGVKSHFRWLRAMGQANPTPTLSERGA